MAKKYTKKFVSLFMVLALSFIFVVPSFAKENNKEKVTFSAKEISDTKEIDKRLSSGITDDSSLTSNIVINDEIVTDEHGKKIKIVPRNIKITSQKVKETIKENGDKKTDYVAYVRAEVSAIPVSKETSISPMGTGGGTQEQYQTDSSYSSTTYLKVTYESNEFTRSPYYYYLFKFNAVSGKIVKLDSQAILQKFTVKNGANGDYYSDNLANNWVGRGTLSSNKDFTYPTREHFLR